MSQANSWLPYYKWMLWGPVVSGFLLPSLINSIYDPAFLIDLAKESDEFVIMSFGSFICDIPFFIVVCFTRMDKERNMSLKRGLISLAIRFLPVFMIYAFLLADVARSAALRLPGASTAPIAILLFQPVAILIVFITNLVLRQLIDSEDAPINA